MPDLVESSSDLEEQVMDRVTLVERTLRELAEPNLNQQPLCIQYVDLEVNSELKSGLIHLLPSFMVLQLKILINISRSFMLCVQV